MAKIDTKITQDLFKVENCPECDGEGKKINTKKYFDPIKKYDQSEIYEDCDICNGSGSL